MKPQRLVLPAVFLFILGTGNIYVGVYKEMQYRQVYEELSVLGPAPAFDDKSPLGRLESFKVTNDRYLQRQLEAKDRLQHYRLVAFGGKTFIGLGIGLLATALLFHVTGGPASRFPGGGQTPSRDRSSSRDIRGDAGYPGHAMRMPRVIRGK